MIRERKPETVLRMPWAGTRFAAKVPLNQRKKRPAPLRGHRPLDFEYLAQARDLRGILEVQFQPELKLARVKGGCRAAVITTVAGSFVEGIDIVEERRR